MLLGLMLVGAVAELVSIGAIVPFLAVLADPAFAAHDGRLAPLLDSLGGDDITILRRNLTLIFVCAALFAAALRLLLLYVSARLNFAIAHDLSSEAYRRTLLQPYATHVERNSSEVIGGIAKVDSIAGVFYNVMLAISAGFMILAIMIALMLVEPVVATLSFATFGLLYGLVSFVSKKKLAANSRIAGLAYGSRVKTIQEGLGGIRDVILDQAHSMFSQRFDEVDSAFRRSQASTYFIGPSPRFVVEGLGMAFIAIMAYTLTRSGQDIRSVIPGLGALALGAQRVMPLLQQLYQGWVTLAGNHHVVSDVLSLVKQPVPLPPSHKAKRVSFEQQLDFREVSFRYRCETPLIVDSIDLTIRKGAKIGIVGETGSGKSTVMDLLMGLLLPSSGVLLVDGQALEGNSQLGWQRAIAHVPQNVFLADGTFAENIAFGTPLSEINMERVERAARGAHIADFINGCASGYQSRIGERGARLSGGQRQRLGIARALYKDATVLVFDEATSALDPETEENVMSAIGDLGDDLTVVLIAHRTTTLAKCDLIYRLANKRLHLVGSYQDLKTEQARGKDA